MVAPLIAAAAITAAGSIAGGVAGGKGAKKAAKTAAASKQQEIAAIERNREYQYGLNAPTIATGQRADDTISALLGIGGDPAAADAAFETYKGSTGYRERLAEGLRGVNNGMFAGGVGQSGAALKALQTRGELSLAGELGAYTGSLGAVSAAGADARRLVAGVGGNATNQFIGSSQFGTGQQIGAINQGTANTQQMIQNLVNAGTFAAGGGGYRSSYVPSAFTVNGLRPDVQALLAANRGGAF
jgi:hypothetical protein